MTIDEGHAHPSPAAPGTPGVTARQRLAVVSMTVETTVAARRRSRTATVTLAGQVDLAVLGRLHVVMAAASVCDHLVVAAAGVDFIDCCALSPLLACADAVAARGGHVLLCRPSPAVAELIAWCHLHDRLPACAPLSDEPLAAPRAALAVDDDQQDLSLSA